MKAHTDLQILNAIFRKHKDDYLAWARGRSSRCSKNYVPVDIKEIADSLHIDVDLVWGRLYYDLDKRYSYREANGAWVHFFSPKVNTDDNCIHFPYLVSVIASLRTQAWKTWLPVGISAAALAVAVATLAWNVFSNLEPSVTSSQTQNAEAISPNERTSIGRVSEASHDLIRLLDEPGDGE